MKYLTAIIALGTALSLSACQTTVSSPGVKVKTSTGLEVEVEDDHHHDGGGKFCPPGQAKKGNC